MHVQAVYRTPYFGSIIEAVVMQVFSVQFVINKFIIMGILLEMFLPSHTIAVCTVNGGILFVQVGPD